MKPADSFLKRQTGLAGLWPLAGRLAVVLTAGTLLIGALTLLVCPVVLLYGGHYVLLLVYFVCALLAERVLGLLLKPAVLWPKLTQYCGKKPFAALCAAALLSLYESAAVWGLYAGLFSVSAAFLQGQPQMYAACAAGVAFAVGTLGVMGLMQKQRGIDENSAVFYYVSALAAGGMLAGGVLSLDGVGLMLGLLCFIRAVLRTVLFVKQEKLAGSAGQKV